MMTKLSSGPFGSIVTTRSTTHPTFSEFLNSTTYMYVSPKCVGAASLDVFEIHHVLSVLSFPDNDTGNEMYLLEVFHTISTFFELLAVLWPNNTTCRCGLSQTDTICERDDMMMFEPEQKTKRLSCLRHRFCTINICRVLPGNFDKQSCLFLVRDHCDNDKRNVNTTLSRSAFRDMNIWQDNERKRYGMKESMHVDNDSFNSDT